MRNLLCSAFFLLLVSVASAQKVYFIYLQSDSGAPFYVKMGDDIYSSSAPGYLILSSLVDSTYQLAIGFSSSNSESKFRVSIGSKDRGLLIKTLESGTVLVDIQTQAILKPLVDESLKSTSYRSRKDEFTMLLSKAARDTSLLWVPVFAKNDAVAVNENKKPTVEPPQPKIDDTKPKVEEPKIKTEEPKPKTEDPKPVTDIQQPKDSIAIEIPQKEIVEVISLPDTTENIRQGQKDLTDSIEQKAVQAIEPPKPKVEEPEKVKEELVVYQRSTVKKHSESSTSEGFGLVFHDKTGSETDTIRLLIPNPKVSLNQPDAQKDENLFLDIDSKKKVPTTDEIRLKNCPGTATDADFFKLRKNMAGEETDEEMVDQAKKFFRNKCFTTEQVKNLSALFLTSAGKYLFFDAAYTHVLDPANFRSLESEIKDEYYSKRFKALIGE